MNAVWTSSVPCSKIAPEKKGPSDGSLIRAVDLGSIFDKTGRAFEGLRRILTWGGEHCSA